MIFSITVEANFTEVVVWLHQSHFPNNVVENIWVNEPLTPAYLTGQIVNTATTVHYDGEKCRRANSHEWWLLYPFEVVAFDYFGPNGGRYIPMQEKSTSVFTGNAGNNGYVQLMGKMNAVWVGKKLGSSWCGYGATKPTARIP